MTKILIATGNRGKYKEILEVLHDLGEFEFVSLADIGLENDAEERGATYEENSLIKAEHFFRTTGMITLAEDSGIEVEALADELGVQTRRWGAGEDASDEEWLAFFLERMKSEENKRAKFVCVPTIVWSSELGVRSDQKNTPNSQHPTPNVIQFRGETLGTILEKPQCPIPHGIPISSVFVADGTKDVYANLSVREKNRISHRGKAMHEVKEFLQKQFS